MMIAGTKCHRYTFMTTAFSRLTGRHRRSLDSSLVAQGSASSTSPAWAAAYASSAIDGGLVLPEPTMSGAKDRDVTRPASRAPPPAVSAYRCHFFDVSERSCQKKPHWWIDPQTNR